ncbi:hypothetical protein GH741_16070 [Aquibacillus halophilus]|uniref:Uncharacterized protein n=1 Tax=Aquibacillus halophilus TaxID=930132 RepID=A0A6A8DK77_9BACI|nr:hypothetical protein [Aquibacillus halophilus]MRH44159.1 hypothetical protein [Aquibacillus halophilus]
MTTLLASLLPLLLMVGLIVLIIFIVKKNGLFRIKQANGNSVKWVLSIYFIILFASTIVFYFLPDDKAASISQEDINKMVRYGQELNNRAHLGTLDESDQLALKNEWQFEATENTLQVTAETGEYNDIIVFVERKDNDVEDKKIEFIKYSTDSLFNHDGYQVDFAHNKLIIKQPSKMDFQFAAIANEFTITQFTGEERLHIRMAAIEPEILYLRVPKDLKLTGNVTLIEQ